MTSEHRVREAATRPWWRGADLWYLVFLANLLFQPLFDPGSSFTAWLAAGIGIGLFLPLYVQFVRGRGPLVRWSPHLATLLGAVLLPFNGGATVLFVFAAAFAGGLASRRVAYVWFTGLSVGMLALIPFVPLPTLLTLLVLGFPAVLVWVVGISVQEAAADARSAQQLRVDNARIEHLATAAERDRIARDLHDLLGHSLTEVVARAQLVRRLAHHDAERTAEEASAIEQSARRALDEVRATVRGWREVRLDDELEVAERTLTAAGISLAVDHDPAFDPPPTTETALALALREAVTNVVRHAQARRCQLRLHRDDGYDVLEVADDGRGGAVVEGSGLAGLRERVLAVGGDVAYDAGAGVTVRVRVPSGIPA